MTAAPAGLLTALVQVQGDMPTLPEDAENPHFKSRYTPLDTIVETVRPILKKHGLVWITLPGSDERGEPCLEYRLLHAATGESIVGRMPLLLQAQTPQGMGSALTYARRYALSAVLNLVSDVDDDGNAGSAPAPARAPGVISDAQRKLVGVLIKQRKPSKEQLRVMLDKIGAEHVLIEEGWTGKLTGGRDGTASQLITWLKEEPLPGTTGSDVPDAEPGEFEHPVDEEQTDPLPFDEAGV